MVIPQIIAILSRDPSCDAPSEGFNRVFGKAFSAAERELDDRDVQRILSLREKGVSTAKIARELGLNQVTVASVLRKNR